MRKLAAILFLFSVLLTVTPAQQILKLPVLVQHYFEHKKLNNGLSFWLFIQAHYFNAGNDTDNDDSRDRALPFKAADNTVLNAINALPGATETDNNYLVDIKELSHMLTDDTFVSSQYLSSIWQPPKVVLC